MLGERIAPCWCYSPIHFEWRRTRVQGDALVRQSVTLNTPCDVDRRIYFTPWRDTGLHQSVQTLDLAKACMGGIPSINIPTNTIPALSFFNMIIPIKSPSEFCATVHLHVLLCF